MDDLNNITHTINGTLVKLVHPVFNTSGTIAGYMCEHTKGWRTFVALQDLKMTETMKQDIAKCTQKAAPVSEVQKAAPKPPKQAEVAATPPPKVEEVTPAEQVTPTEQVPVQPEPEVSSPFIVEIPLGEVSMNDEKKDQPAVAPAAPAAAPVAPVEGAPKKRTRRTKAQMEEARKAGLVPPKKDVPKAAKGKPGRKPGKAAKAPKAKAPKAKAAKAPKAKAAKKPAKEVKHRVRRTKAQIAAGVSHEEAVKLASKK